MNVKVKLKSIHGSVYRLIDTIAWNEYGYVATGSQIPCGDNELPAGSIIIQSVPAEIPINFYFNCYRVMDDGELETLALYYEDKYWKQFNSLVNYYFKNRYKKEI